MARRHASNNGHLVYVPSERAVRIFRAVKRVVLSDRWSQTHFDACVATPTSPNGPTAETQATRNYNTGTTSAAETASSSKPSDVIASHSGGGVCPRRWGDKPTSGGNGCQKVSG